MSPEIPKPTEFTIRDLFVKELEIHGIRASQELSFSTPIGRMQIDILLENGATYAVQTKVGTEAKLFDALTQCYDNLKYIGVQGAFALLFPDELAKPMATETLRWLAPKVSYSLVGIFKDERPTVRRKDSFSKIAAWIAEQVLKPPAYIEPDTAFAISVLRSAVQYVTAFVGDVGEGQLEDIFGGKSIFENVLQYEEGKYPLTEMRHAAIYLLINQILFYQVLSQAIPKQYPVLDETAIHTPEDLRPYFNKVLEVNYTPTFGFDIASRLPLKVAPAIRDVVKVVKALAPEKIGHDLLGKVFHSLIPFDTRKTVAAFYTNNEAAEMLAELAIENVDDKIVDMACGSGTLLVAAYHKKMALLEGSGKRFGAEDHKRFLNEDLTGIDVMPFAAHLAVIHLALQAPIYETDRVRMAVWDSTALKPGQVIPAISREVRRVYQQPTLDMWLEGKSMPKESAFIETGSLTLDKIGGDEIPLEKADVVIMNPPFTRQERIPEEYKSALNRRFREYSDCLHGQLGFYGYFILLADRFLEENGRIALVLPAVFLRLKSTLGIRRILSEKYTIEYIVNSWQKLAFSEGAWFRDILLVARKKRAKGAELCSIVTLKTTLKDTALAKQCAEEIKEDRQILESPHEGEMISTIKVSQSQLSESVENWFDYIAVRDQAIRTAWNTILSKEKGKLVQLGNFLNEVGANCVRGIETRKEGGITVQSAAIMREPGRMRRARYRWVLRSVTRDELVVEDRSRALTVKVPVRAVQPAFLTASGVGKLDISGMFDFVVVNQFDDIDAFFLERPQKFDLLFASWYRYVAERLGTLLISRRLVLPVPGMIHVCYYSDTPVAGPGMMWIVQGLSNEDAMILALWMNSAVHIAQILLNKSQDIWVNVHKYTLEDFLILSPKALDQPQRKTLVEAFIRVKDESFPSLFDQLKYGFHGRQEIDGAILKALGLSEKEIKSVLGYLYPALISEIETLKSLMEG